MAEQRTHPETGRLQPEKPKTLERPVESFEEDLADNVHEKAKSGDQGERAVARASSISKAASGWRPGDATVLD